MKERVQKILEIIRKDSSLTRVWLGVAALLVVGFALSLLFFYLAPRDNTFVQNTVKYMPYPIAFISGNFVTEFTLTHNMNSVRQFYQNQDFSGAGLRVDLTTDEGKKRLRIKEKEVFNKMVEDKAIESIADAKGIEITDEEVKQDIKNRIDAYGTGEEVAKSLNRLYGWSLKDFAEKVVKPALYQQKLIEVYEQEVDQTEARAKIEAAEKDITRGQPFDEVAKQYSEGNTGSAGGELGWFQLIDLSPELQPVVQNALPNTASAIVETSLGYHIVLVHEVKNDQNVTLYRISQVFVRKTTFSEWLTREMQGLSLSIWSPFYRWNQERAEVEFMQQSWQQYEQSVYANGADDALFVE